MPELEANEIDARPTKEFFIEAITQDITLLDIIPDLVDNCLDGALRTGRKDDPKGLKIEIEINKQSFKIKDNCGGIPLKIAKEYAFRFGKGEHDKPIPGSIGYFGIGMKRAIFKMGNKIRIESKTVDDHFLIEIDVEGWKKKRKWTFEFRNISESPNHLTEPGTIIEVTDLHKNASEEFDDLFENELANRLQEANTIHLEKGLLIILNSKPLKFEALTYLVSEKIIPAYKKIEIGEGQKKVDVEIYAGVSNPSPSEAGWYIFCNGRLVLSADKNEETGWSREGKKELPQFHNYFAYFRGFVFFNSLDTSRLPWDTTKTRVNTDSNIYKAAKLEMIKLSKPVITFLRKLAKEKQRDEEGNKPETRPLNDEIEKADEKNFLHLKITERIFEVTVPETPSKPKPKEKKIIYTKPEELVNEVKKSLGVSTLKKVGEKTFDYYYKHQVEE